MDEQINTPQPQPLIQYMMIPVMMPAPPKLEEKKPEPAPGLSFGAALFWAAVILGAMWFISGGWEVVR